MPKTLYPQLPTAPSISQESFNIEMVRKYYQDILNLKEKYTEKQLKYKNAYNRLLHASTGGSSVALASGVSTIGMSVTIVGLPINASLAIVSTVSTCVGACLLLTSKKYKKKLLKCYKLLDKIRTSLATFETLMSLSIDDNSVIDAKEFHNKGSYQLTSKFAKEVAQAFQWIYENTPLNYPKILIVDDGKEFYGDMTKLMEKHDVIIQRGDPSQNRSQGIVERFNRTLADRLFTYQYHKELEDTSKSNREWVSRLQNVVSSLNNEKTRLTGMKPVDAIKQTLVEQGFSQPVKEYEEKLLNFGTKVRYLYEPGELEGYQYKGERRK